MTTPHRFSVLLFAFLITQTAGAVRRHTPVEFSYSESNVTSSHVALTPKQQQRIERFLSAVYPVRSMKRLEHTREEPVIRHVTYSVVDQDGSRFIIAGYTARWGYVMPGQPQLNPVNVFAVYRVEGGAPNQVWRSKPWEANYYRLAIQTAQIGKRNIVLFEEGGAPGEFGLASVFTFANEKNGIAINDLTPSLPWVWARTHFPFRPLYGQSIALKMDEANKDLVLTASDQSYQVGLVTASQLERTWKYVPKRNRFEQPRERRLRPSQLTHAEVHIGD